MDVNTLYQEFDDELRSAIQSIIWARQLYETRSETVVGRTAHQYKAMQRRQAVLHAIYRFDYMTSTTANTLLQHSTRNNTATFLSQMIKEGLIRRYEVRDECKFIYLLRKPVGLNLLQKTFNKMGWNSDLIYDVDASKIGSSESIFHHELISKSAINANHSGGSFALEPEIKKATTKNGMFDEFQPKLNDLIVSTYDGSVDGNVWIAYEYEVSAKSEERIHYMLRKSEFLIATGIVSEINWMVSIDKTYDIIHAAIGNSIPTYTRSRFGKYSPSGNVFNISEHQIVHRINEQKTNNYRSNLENNFDILDYSDAL